MIEVGTGEALLILDGVVLKFIRIYPISETLKQPKREGLAACY